jgi:hypothetical protein
MRYLIVAMREKSKHIFLMMVQVGFSLAPMITARSKHVLKGWRNESNKETDMNQNRRTTGRDARKMGLN